MRACVCAAFVRELVSRNSTGFFYASPSSSCACAVPHIHQHPPPPPVASLRYTFRLIWPPPEPALLSNILFKYGGGSRSEQEPRKLLGVLYLFLLLFFGKISDLESEKGTPVDKRNPRGIERKQREWVHGMVTCEIRFRAIWRALEAMRCYNVLSPNVSFTHSEKDDKISVSIFGTVLAGGWNVARCASVRRTIFPENNEVRWSRSYEIDSQI